MSLDCSASLAAGGSATGISVAADTPCGGSASAEDPKGGCSTIGGCPAGVSTSELTSPAEDPDAVSAVSVAVDDTSDCFPVNAGFRGFSTSAPVLIGAVAEVASLRASPVFSVVGSLSRLSARFSMPGSTASDSEASSLELGVVFPPFALNGSRNTPPGPTQGFTASPATPLRAAVPGSSPSAMPIPVMAPTPAAPPKAWPKCSPATFCVSRALMAAGVKVLVPSMVSVVALLTASRASLLPICLAIVLMPWRPAWVPTAFTAPERAEALGLPIPTSEPPKVATGCASASACADFVPMKESGTYSSASLS